MTNSTKKPTHIIRHVVKDGEYTRSTKVGVIWPHEDGKGFNIDLDFLPIKTDGFISARPPKPEA